MNAYLAIVLAAIVGEYLLAFITEWLNLRHISTELPDEFRQQYDADRYRTSQRYLRANTRLGLANRTVFTLATVAFILAGGFGWLDRLVRLPDMGPIATGLAFVAVLALGSQILRLPFSVYETFAIEQHYGFNRTTPRTFVADRLKEWTLLAIVGGALYAAVLWLFGRWGPSAWLACWAAVTGIQILVLSIAPVVILPLFNKFTPLEDADARRAIESYARAQQFRTQGIFTMDGSRRSSKSNAFFTGFGRFRRIVLYDTLVAKHSADELVAIVAHEMGHYRKHHILRFLIVSGATSAGMFFLLSLLINNRGLFDAFQVRDLSIYASLVFAAFLYSPLGVLLSVLTNILSRRFEYQADAYALASSGLAQPMIAALKKLTVDNLGNLSPHPLKVFLDYSHPPILDRIRSLQCPPSPG